MEDKGNKQGFNKEIFVKAIRLAAGTNNFVQAKIFDAIVKSGSQNRENLTCIVDSINSNINNLQVRYHLLIDDGEIRVPADDSLVTIAMTEFTDPYIVKDTELINYDINVGDTIISLVNGKSTITQGKCVITLSNGKINIKNDNVDFKTVQDKLYDILLAMTFTNGAGTTGFANNSTDINNNKIDFDKLFN